jgi:hypothetical protein
MQTKCSKYCNLTLLLTLLCVASVSLMFTSCQKEKEDNTVVLYSFGPMPIARGAELRFIGNNLDRVTSVVLPDNLTITEFTTQTSELLTLTVPQEAVEGYVVLKASSGDITTKTKIGFSEPISIASFSPATIKPGATLTITGDYLNLVGAVIFNDGVSVDSTSFTSQSRAGITLVVPAAAQTGKFAVSNAATDPIIVYSATELSVTLPAFTAISPNPVKAGSELTITGTNLDLVKTVVLGGSKSVTSFTSQTETSLVLTVPAAAQDGVVTIIPASGVNVTSTDELVMVVPTVGVTPTTLKNGENITVTGTDLDLISSVVFGGTKTGIIQAGGTSTEIIVKVPDDAVTGVVTFNTNSGKSVTGPVVTMIDPTITSISPTEGKPKTSVTIAGTDLDLVSTATFMGGIKGTITSQSITELVVTIPVGAKTGSISLTTKNGRVILTDSFTVLQNLPNVSGYAESRGEQGKILTIQGTGLLLIKELIFPDNIAATAYGEKTDTKVEVYVPDNVPVGYGQITMVTYEGEEGLLPSIYFGTVAPVYDQTLCFFDFNGTGKDSWWGNAIGSGILDDDATSADNTPYWRINGTSGTGWWDGLFFRNGSNNFVTTGVDVNTWAVKFDIYVNEPISEGELRIRLGSYYYYFKPWADGTPYSTVGWITVTCPLTGFVDGSGNVLTDPSVGGSEFGMIWCSGTAVKINMGIDNVRFEPL